MKSALFRLRESQDSMSATERAVSDYLLSHQGEAMGLSIHQLAEKTFSSPSTVTLITFLSSHSSMIIVGITCGLINT